MKVMRNKNAAGYTFVELLIIVVVIVVLATTLIINLGPIILTVDIEQTTSQVAASLSIARRAALSGDSKAINREFDINKALPAKHPGILVDSKTDLNTNCQNTECPGITGKVIKSICVSGLQFCYEPSNKYQFEQYTGELDQAHAIFISSRSRTLAVLVNQVGKVEIAEYVNNQWRTRNDLQKLSN
jgi:Tfp pilus assembly protein FimT